MKTESNNNELPSSKMQVTVSPTMANVIVFFKWLNAFCGLSLITLGVLRYIFYSISIQEPWTIFQPAYLIIFGIIIFGAEIKNGYILEQVNIVQEYFGRGIVEIFVATICSSYSGGTGLNVCAVIITISLFIIGIAYIFFTFLGYHAQAQLIIEEQPTDKTNEKGSEKSGKGPTNQTSSKGNTNTNSTEKVNDQNYTERDREFSDFQVKAKQFSIQQEERSKKASISNPNQPNSKKFTESNDSQQEKSSNEKDISFGDEESNNNQYNNDAL